MATPEILAVLQDEVAEVVDGMSAALGDINASSNVQRLREALEFFSEQIERIKSASDILGLTGLKAICMRITDNLMLLQDTHSSHAAIECFMRGPNLMLDYLRAPKALSGHTALLDYLADAHWPQPIGDADAAMLMVDLCSVEEALAEAEKKPARPTEATPEDVMLDSALDINPLLIESFLAEGPMQAADYTRLIEGIIRDGAEVESLQEARRLVHSIKGAANTVGVRGIAALAHHLEDLLDFLNDHAARPEGAVAKLLMDAADCLEMMFESLMAQEPTPPQAENVLQRLLDVGNAMDRGEDIYVALTAPAAAWIAAEVPVLEPQWEAIEFAVEAHAQAQAQAQAQVEFEAEANANAEANVAETPKPKVEAARAEISPKVRVAVTAIEEMLRLSGEMTIGRSHVKERLHQVFMLTSELRERHTTLHDRANELDRVLTMQGITAGQKQGAAGSGAPNAVFDALELDQYSELHGAAHGFLETIADLQTLESRMLDALAMIETGVTQEGLINSELHEHVMRARMVEAATLEPRLMRTVRQAGEATGKQVRLVFTGGDVMLDDHVVNDLINPLSHLLRNAVDHGIEDEQTRAATGKPMSGEIRLAFVREGNHMVARCSDDGQGLNLPHIRMVAVERGLISADAALDDATIAQLILLHGFSTRSEVSEVSGRGVGMDVVNTMVRKLNGTLDIATEAGRGCRFTLRIPMTLGTAHCLVVRAGSEISAIPSDTLDRAIYQGAHNVERQGERYIYREAGESLEIYDLAHLLGVPSESLLGDPQDHRSVLVVNDAGGKKAVVVDQLISGGDHVIKRLGRHLTQAPGVLGASLLGDGRVLPVLDVPALLRMQSGAVQSGRPYLVSSQAQVRSVRTASHILVVDDSLTVRQTLQLLLTGEGYNVHTAKDGAEALDYITKTPPAAIVTDLEMPRMNGLDMVARVRALETGSQLPIIMVTSRSSEKHRQQAQLVGVDCYLTKPFREIELLTQLHSMLTKAKVA